MRLFFCGCYCKPAKKSSPNSKKSYWQEKSIAKQRRQNGLFGRLKQSIGDLSSFYCGKLR